MSHQIRSPKKLIEVALPLDAINHEAAKEKNNPFIKKHPRSIHTWWARRPFTAARALLFAQLVNDPGYQHGSGFRYGRNKKDAALERKRLFGIVSELAKWENTTNEALLRQAREEIRRSWKEVCELNKDHPEANELFNPDVVPGLHDPFAGGGAIPVESQRLGIDTIASDLNPVAVLINKAMIELPSRFKDIAPVHDAVRKRTGRLVNEWGNASGLADDVRHYGSVIRDRAQAKLASLFPDVEITKKMASGRTDLKPYVGTRRPIVACIRARTVETPNPAFRLVWVPLISTYILSSKAGKEAYIEPVVDGSHYTFRVRMGRPPVGAKTGTKLARGGNFQCLVSGVPIEADYVRNQGMQGRLRTCLIAVVVEGNRKRLYLPPVSEYSEDPLQEPTWYPAGQMYGVHRAFTPAIYGLADWKSVFTRRQLVSLDTLFCEIESLREEIVEHAFASGQFSDRASASRYSSAVCTYLALATSRWADFSNTICSWNSINQNIRIMFARQAIQMSWDFAEIPPFGPIGPWTSCLEANVEALTSISTAASGRALQADASAQDLSVNRIIATDPPYYDNVPYADLSDFFYVWLRRSLRQDYPDLFGTISVPKEEELVATPTRHGGREAAESFFLEGMTSAMKRLAQQSHPAFPVTVYYAFKQSETSDSDGTSSTGWVTFLEAVLEAGFQIVGTWPVRTEKQGRARANDSNALASSIVLVCRKRGASSPAVSRRAFIRELSQVLPEALDEITRGVDEINSPVAPVDLSQAIIGPGMAVFSKYRAVLEADGSPMSVRTALQLINRFLAEDDFDADTQFCLHWFEQHHWETGKFGEADTLARAKGTSVDGVKQSGVLYAAGGNVRLFKWAEYPTDWKPSNDGRLPVWEALHQLIRVFRTGGESNAGALLAAVLAKAESARQLAYRLYTLCERAGMAEDARAYNELITSWSAIESAAAREPAAQQRTLFE